MGDLKLRKEGAWVKFPFDRGLVDRFQARFRRARFSDDRSAWFLPGKTAHDRFDRWLDRESAAHSPYDDERGRDAAVFDPISSDYIETNADELVVLTPYSRTVVEQMRAIPFAAWDADTKTWRIPFRSYEHLRRRWETIEAAAERNEPHVRKFREVERRGSDQELKSRARNNERRKHRHPLAADDLPPLDTPVHSRFWGIIVFTDIHGEIVDVNNIDGVYEGLPVIDLVWGSWRSAKLDELVATWPQRRRNPVGKEALWWRPSIDELQISRKAARSLELRAQKRSRPQG